MTDRQSLASDRPLSANSEGVDPPTIWKSGLPKARSSRCPPLRLKVTPMVRHIRSRALMPKCSRANTSTARSPAASATICPKRRRRPSRRPLLTSMLAEPRRGQLSRLYFHAAGMTPRRQSADPAVAGGRPGGVWGADVPFMREAVSSQMRASARYDSRTSAVCASPAHLMHSSAKAR